MSDRSALEYVLRAAQSTGAVGPSTAREADAELRALRDLTPSSAIRWDELGGGRERCTASAYAGGRLLGSVHLEVQTTPFDRGGYLERLKEATERRVRAELRLALVPDPS